MAEAGQKLSFNQKEGNIRHTDFSGAAPRKRMTEGVSAVTVTWNSEREIKACLDSLSAEAGIREIIVIDNASTDGTRDVVRAFPDAVLIENPANAGFAAAANQGIRASSGEFILLINPDVSFGPGFLAPLAAAMEADPESGAAAPLLLRPDGETVDSAGLVMKKSRKALDIGRDEKGAGRFGKPCRVFGASGAAALYRRRMLEDAAEDGEYFDETFFAYKEDVDLAWRANLLGWKTLFVPSAVALHARGWKASGRACISRGIRRISHRNRYLSIIKNDDPANLLLHLPQVLFYEAKLLLYSILREPFLLLAFIDLARRLHNALRKRSKLMRRRKVGPAGMRGLYA